MRMPKIEVKNLSVCRFGMPMSYHDLDLTRIVQCVLWRDS